MRSATMGGGEIGVPWCLRKRWHPSFFSHRTGCTQSLPRHVYLDLFFFEKIVYLDLFFEKIVYMDLDAVLRRTQLCCDALNETVRLIK